MTEKLGIMSIPHNFKVFQPDIESVEEFVQRFKLQNNLLLKSAQTDELLKASYLASALLVNVITTIQRRIKPKLLVELRIAKSRNNLLRPMGIKRV